jgi:dihydrofolate reductase
VIPNKIWMISVLVRLLKPIIEQIMRKIVSFMHVSLDGFVAGPKGEMNWIHVDEEMFEYSFRQTELSDTGLYGRVTYQMMEAYWPTAGIKSDASKHDKEHSAWYNKVAKVIVSRTMKGENLPNTVIISENLREEILKIKEKPGKDIVIFGSPSTSHALMAEDLIDEFWLFVNPILLGKGIPLFKGIQEARNLKFLSSHIFVSGVVGLHYHKGPEK